MIRMPIRRRRRNDERRLPRPQLRRQSRYEASAAGEQEGCEALVGKVEEGRTRDGNSETGEGFERLGTAALGPADAGARVESPPAFDRALGPGIVLPVGDEDDPHRRAGGDRPLQPAAPPERLLVRE